MRNKPLKFRRHKPRPIMDLLPHSEHILKNLLDSPESINGLFRKLQQTGFTYKVDVLDSINYLVKAGLVRKEPDAQHSTKILASLTNVGNTIAGLIISTKRYTESMVRLDKKMKQNFDKSLLNCLGDLNESEEERIAGNVSTTKVQKAHRLLGEKGWNEDERNVFIRDGFTIPHGFEYLFYQSPQCIIGILLYKYAVFVKSNINQIAKIIIQGITIELITRVLRCIQDVGLQSELGNEDYGDYLSELVMKQIEAVSGSAGLVYEFMNNDVFEVFKSMISFVGPKREFLRKRTEKGKEYLKELQSDKFDEHEYAAILKLFNLEKIDKDWRRAQTYKDMSLSRLIGFYDTISKTD